VSGLRELTVTTLHRVRARHGAREENAAAHTETRREFAETAQRVGAENQHFSSAATEGLRHEIQLIAEGVTGTREALNREGAAIREKKCAARQTIPRR
jgi:hypothetical protein